MDLFKKHKIIDAKAIATPVVLHRRLGDTEEFGEMPQDGQNVIASWVHYNI